MISTPLRRPGAACASLRLLTGGLLLAVPPQRDHSCACWLLGEAAGAVAATSGGGVVLPPPVQAISPLEVEALQKRWGDGICQLSKLHSDGQPAQAYVASATAFVAELYGYGSSNSVLFAPAEATERQFRTTLQGAVAYYVGNDQAYPEDDGFALRGWRKVRFQNVGIHLVDGEAIAMGNYYFTNASGLETALEYSFGIFRDDSGLLKINLHHSSYPYTNATVTNVKGITEKEIYAAQKTWADDLIEIGQYHSKGFDYRQRANTFVNSAYAYDLAEVLFKPTEALQPQFRKTRDGALSYFVGGDSHFPEDWGFALTPWTAASFSNDGIILDGQRAWALGNMMLTAADGGNYEAQYVFGYLRDKEGALRLNLHHSTFARGGRSGQEALMTPESGSVTQGEIEAAQRAWAEGLVAIGAQYTMNADYRLRAQQFVDQLYAYSTRPVFFKPAEALKRPFRSEREGAISYFVGGDPLGRYPEDQGLALKPWKAARFANAEFALQGEQALAMGNMFLMDSNGIQTKVEYTLGYVRDDADKQALRVNLHHASIPYEGTRRLKSSFLPISSQEVEKAQKDWGDGIVKIAQNLTNRTLYTERAQRLVDDLYGFGTRPVLMRVTDTNEGHFRLTREGAVSALIGRSEEFPNDVGLAMRPWVDVAFDNSGGISLFGDRAMSMGNCVFKDADGTSMAQEYSLGYFRTAEGLLNIDLHFMSWPFRSKQSPLIPELPSIDYKGLVGAPAYAASNFHNWIPSLIVGALALMACAGFCFALCVGQLQPPTAGMPKMGLASYYDRRSNFYRDDSGDGQRSLGYGEPAQFQNQSYAPVTGGYASGYAGDYGNQFYS